ncbi:MAG: hypothetical protein AB8G17_00895 [Gammaproteobacteria bacterium]
MKKTLSALALIALLGGCAGSSTPTSSNAAPVAKKAELTEAEQLREDEILCTREMRTGSHRKSRVCRTVAQRKKEQQAAAEILRNTQNGGTRAIN